MKTSAGRIGRGVILVSGLALSAVFLVPALDYQQAQQLLAQHVVASQQQVSEEFVSRMSLPELLVLSDQAFRHDPPRFDLAAVACARGVELEPRDGETWTRLAYARLGDAGYWTADALDAMRTAYYRMPYGDRDFRRWRLRLVDSSWPAMPPDIQNAALREARTEAPDWLSRNLPDLSARTVPEDA